MNVSEPLTDMNVSDVSFDRCDVLVYCFGVLLYGSGPNHRFCSKLNLTQLKKVLDFKARCLQLAGKLRKEKEAKEASLPEEEAREKEDELKRKGNELAKAHQESYSKSAKLLLVKTRQFL
jgi:hypothetical protein